MAVDPGMMFVERRRLLMIASEVSLCWADLAAEWEAKGPMVDDVVVLSGFRVMMKVLVCMGPY